MHCSNCKRLSNFAKSNCMEGYGSKKATVMVVGDFPNDLDDQKGSSFTGRLGMLVNALLTEASIKKESVYFTNAVKCASPNGKININEIRLCRDYFEKEVRCIQPKVILLLGNVPLNSALVLFKKRKEEDEKKSGGVTGIAKWRGKDIWHKDWNCWVVPSYSISQVLQNVSGKNPNACLVYRQAVEDFNLAKSLLKRDIPIDVNPKTYLVSTLEGAKKVLLEIGKSNVFAFDTETTGLDVFKDKVVGLSFCDRADRGFYFDWLKLKKYKEVRLLLNNLLTDSTKLKIMQNGSFDYKMCVSNIIKINNCYYDTMLAAHLLDENFPKGLKDSTWRYLTFGGYEKQLDDYIRDHKCGYGDVPVGIMSKYSALDAVATFRLWKGTDTFKGFEFLLKENDLWDLYQKIVTPVRFILNGIELNGFEWDKLRAERLERDLNILQIKIEKKIYALVGYDFNIASRPQLSKVLYDTLKMVSKNKTKKGGKSTDKFTLEEFAEQKENKKGSTVAQLLLDLSYIKKNISTYIKGMYKYVDQNGRIHPNYDSCGTHTGRLSCHNPGVHNIPRDAAIRSLYQSSKGCDLVHADIKAAELRILACYSGEAALIDAFKQKKDPHKETYRTMFEKPDSYDVSDDEKMVAKTINFGLIYGRGPKSLAEKLGITMQKARDFVATYFKKLPKVKRFLNDNILFARENGFVVSMFGRKRRLPDLFSEDFMLKSSAERQANNFVVQSAAADYTYIVLIRIFKELKKRNISASIVHTVHDCIILEVLKKNTKEVVQIVKDQFSKPLKAVPIEMEVDVHVGSKWGEEGDSKIHNLIEKFIKK